MKKIGNVLWGVVFIVLGLIWGLNAMGVTDINVFFHGWWTLFIIIPSFIGLFKSNNKLWNAIFLTVGILLLLGAQRIIPLYMIRKLLLPTILILLGIGFLFKDVFRAKINTRIQELNKEGLKEYTATFGEQKVNLQGEELEGANLDAVFGSVDFDFRDAVITKDIVLNASAIFGGINILAPTNVSIEVKSTPIFGGVDNHGRKVKGENIPTVYINAFCMFGGVEIR